MSVAVDTVGVRPKVYSVDIYSTYRSELSLNNSLRQNPWRIRGSFESLASCIIKNICLSAYPNVRYSRSLKFSEVRCNELKLRPFHLSYIDSLFFLKSESGFWWSPILFSGLAIDSLKSSPRHTSSSSENKVGSK